MKNLFLAILLCSFCVCISCDKQDEVDISPDSLTQCKSGYECLYTFAGNLSVDSNRVKPGKYNVFTYERKSNDNSNDLLLGVDPRTNETSFLLGKKEIQNGQVAYRFSCPACNTVDLKPADGFVKGKKINDTSWLLDIKIALAEVTTGKTWDTLKLKQYFSLKNN